MTTTTELLDDVPFVYVIPWERFIYRSGTGRQWAFDSPVSKEGIEHHLKSLRWPDDMIKSTLENRSYVKVYGYDREPGQQPLYKDSNGLLHINIWDRPTLVPKAGTYPRIEKLFDFLTNHDVEGQRWLKQWLAWKLQTPSLVPKVCVLITTEPGGGKGTLYTIISHMLGAGNCHILERDGLESRFNASWVGKLFVMGDEILSDETVRDVSNRLKVYIDGTTLNVEAKFQNQRTIRNRLAWLFASNNPVSPIVVERNDRRYSVFSNHDKPSREYQDLFYGLFESDRKTPTADFMAEIAALYHELLHTQVDVAFVSRPHDNEARRDLISASMPGHQAFFDLVEEQGIDGLLEVVKSATHDVSLFKTPSEWDWGTRGVATSVLYRCYGEFCKQSGVRPLGLHKFGAAIRAHRPVWPRVRGKDGRRLWGYCVPRNPNAPTDGKVVSIKGAVESECS